ncbi:MAG: Ig-like domain repeat protein [Acidobacteria bacterium]|nr:Ig-like domain repeat protein [Acidobacteriota bacterium]
MQLTATVSVQAPGAGTPTGLVEFFDGASSLGIAAVNPAGQAVFSRSDWAVGTHSLKAAYLGDDNFNGSDSPAQTHIVSDATTVTYYIGFDQFPDRSAVDGTAPNGSAFPGTMISTQYAGFGAIFPSFGGGPIATVGLGEASSSPNFLVGGDLISFGPLIVDIVDRTTGARSEANRIKVTLISVGDMVLTTTALAADLTTVLDSVSASNPGTGVGLNNKDPIVLTGPGIARVKFTITSPAPDDGFGIDDLYIEFKAP